MRRRSLLGVSAAASVVAFLPAGLRPGVASAGPSSPAEPEVAPEFRLAHAAAGGNDFLGRALTRPEYYGGTLVQYFTRGRLELADRNALAPLGSIRLADLGVFLAEISGASRARAFLPPQPSGALNYFPETDHNLGGPFTGFWTRGPGARLLGPPISEPFFRVEAYVQWFARGRLEGIFEARFDEGVRMADVGLEYLQYSRVRRDSVELVGPPSGEEPVDPEGGVDVPILYYHQVTDAGTFERQLDGLLQAAFTPIPLARLVRVLAWGGSLPPNPLVFTFDDGLTSQLTVGLPLLVKYRIPATFFVMPGFHEKRPGYMTPADFQLLADAGMSVQSHGMNHADLPRLLAANLGAAQAEVVVSRQELSRFGGGEYFAYPFGGFDPGTEALVAAAGYQAAVTTRPGRLHRKADLFQLSRIAANASATPETVLSALKLAAAADRRRLKIQD